MRIQVNQKLSLRNYACAFNVVLPMKTEAKKVPRNFRLEAELERELSRRSELTGLTETKILEDALRNHFGSGMKRALFNVVTTLENAVKPSKNPSKRKRGLGIEPRTLTVSRIMNLCESFA